MHVEVRFYFTPLFPEEHRKQKAGAEHAPKTSQEACPSTWAKLLWHMPIAGQEIPPNYHVPIFNLRQARINVLLTRVRLGRRQDAIQVRGIRFVLLMMLEGVNVGSRHAPRGDFEHR